jgi:hypothetical protein
MADTVTTKILSSGDRNLFVLLTSISDGTGETAVKKVDKSTLVNLSGDEPARLSIRKIEWTSYGFATLRLYWDHTAPETAAVLAYNGELCFERVGSLGSAGTGGTGDLMLTATPAPSATVGGYSILLHLML